MKSLTKLLMLSGLFLLIGCSSEPYVELYFTEGSANVATGAYVTMEAVTEGENNANLTFLWRKSSSDAFDTIYGTPFSPRYSYPAAGTYTIECWVSNGEWGSATKTITVSSGGGGGGGGTAPALPGPATPSGLPIHSNIKASTFWCGEGASDANDFITNTSSAWDGTWGANFGLEDKPLLARDSRHIPTSSSYKKKENPYYFALPYNDFGSLAYDGSGAEQNVSTGYYGGDYDRKTSVTSIPWAGTSSNWMGSQSMVKNRWIRLRVTGTSNWVYAQWEDAGPYYYNDVNYLFGSSSPANSTDAPYAGIDLSPSVCLALGQDLESWGAPTFNVDWQFVDAADVPAGPWTVYCTTTQTNW